MTIAYPARFENVPVPGSGGSLAPDDLAAEVTAWVDSEALRALLDHFGAPPMPSALDAKLQALEDFTAEAWDYRRSADGQSLERNQVNLAAIDDPATEDLVRAAATALGLVEARPPLHHEYDYIVVLGGLVRANLWRSAYAAHLLATGTVSAPEVVALTAHRPLAANPDDPDRDEFKLLGRLGLPEATLESEVMAESLVSVFGLPGLTDVVADGDDIPLEARRQVLRATTPAGTEVTLVVAPAADPASGRRADTATTYRFWADEVDHIHRGARVLVSTSAIYVPYHGLVALQHLGVPFGAQVETVGYDERVIDTSAAPQIFRAVNFTQEIRSALRAAATLCSQLGLS